MTMMTERRTFLLGLTTAGLCSFRTRAGHALPNRPQGNDRAGKLVAHARAQIGVTLRYDPAYTSLLFPGGDVPREKGVCTDVMIRAYRDAFGIDLQALVHADMRKSFAAYPKKWGLARPDRSIDHRRVPNLARFLARMGAERPIRPGGKGWQPGDIFTSIVGGNAPHIGIVSDRIGARAPLVLHNIGHGAREEDALLDWPITGRFRWKV